MGKGRLTDNCSNTFQNYFGLAIRQNKSDIDLMKKCIGAVVYHCSDILDDNVCHQFCPKSRSRWCKWQNDQINNTKTYRSNINLPIVIKRLIEPIFRDLRTDSLLENCLHGQTKNSNEASNGVVVVVVYYILSRLLYLAFSATLGLLCMSHQGMGPLV